MKQMPISSKIFALSSGSNSIFTPKASNTSAAPDLEETPRFPCFATGIPALATTMDAVVEILNVFAPSPPVPTISSTS